jgi:hypothetical protein
MPQRSPSTSGIFASRQSLKQRVRSIARAQPSTSSTTGGPRGWPSDQLPHVRPLGQALAFLIGAVATKGLAGLGEGRAGRRKSRQAREWEQIRQAAQQGWLIGREAFQQEIEAMTGRRLVGKHVEDPERRDQSPVKKYSDPIAGPMLSRHHEPHLGSKPCRVD